MRAINSRLMAGAFLVCLTGWAIPAESAVLTVDPQGTDFKTIQQALDAILDRGAVIVRFLAGFSLVTGAIVLIGAVSASRLHR